MSCFKLQCERNHAGESGGVSPRILSSSIMLLLVAGSFYLLGAAEPRRLTHDGRAKQDPVFASQGEAIDFAVYESQIQISLVRLQLANGEQTRINPKANTSEFEPAYSRNGTHMAFVQSRGNLNLKLVIRDLKTGQDAVFDAGGGFSGLHSPAFQPGTDRVFMSLPAKGGQQIASVNLQAQDRRELTTWAGITNWPSFSPDGRQILFASSKDGDYEIYSMDSDGSNLRRLTESNGRDTRPQFSPDASQISFVSVRDGNPEIYVMDRRGSQIRRVTNHPERDDYPSWHPNGRQLVLMSERLGKTDMYLVDVP